MKEKIHNFGFRVAMVIFFFLGGLVFPLLFFVSAFIAWSLIEDSRNPGQEVDDWFTRRYTAAASDQDWKSYYLKFCESPAETAFLEAMIGAFGLCPDKGVLRGGGVTLDIQVNIKPYRADFIVNEWLVVEVDGAAFHSSDEAVERDRARDKYINGSGYSVLRIPARIVFASPGEAVGRVRAFIAEGRQISAALGREQDGLSEVPVAALNRMFSSIDNAIDKLNESVSIKTIVEKENRALVAAFAAEKCVIEASIRRAESMMNVDKFRSRSEAHRSAYDAALEEINRELERKSVGLNAVSNERDAAKISIPVVPERIPHSDARINDAIEKDRLYILNQRMEFFDDVKRRLKKNDALQKLVKKQLDEFGCGECWLHIS